jgi:hypothetical protein
MTTTTAFLTPGTVTQVTDDNGIAWSNILGSVGRDQAGAQSAVTSKELYTISGLWQERFASKTNQLWFTNFNIPNLRTYTTYVPQVGYTYTYATGHNGITTGPTTSTTMQVDLGWDKILTLFTPDASTSNWSISDSGQLDDSFSFLSQINYSLTTGSLSTNTFYVIIANNTVQGTYRNGLLYLTANIQNALPSFDVASGTTLYFYNVQTSLGFRHFPTIASQIVWADSSVSVIGSGYMGSYYYPGDTAGNVNLTMVSTTVNSKAFPIAIQTTNYAPAVPSTISYVPTILGIEVQFNSLRVNRVQDYIVQLVLNGALVGDNIADPITDNLKTYGSPTNIWNSSIALTDMSNATFGVAISLRSNVLTPHSDLGYLDQVRMRITYG